MEIHHSISQNTLSFLVEKILYFEVDGCPKNKSLFLNMGLISSDASSHWAYKHGRLARSNNQDDSKEKSSAINISANIFLLIFIQMTSQAQILEISVSRRVRNIFLKIISNLFSRTPSKF